MLNLDLEIRDLEFLFIVCTRVALLTSRPDALRINVNNLKVPFLDLLTSV